MLEGRANIGSCWLGVIRGGFGKILGRFWEDFGIEDGVKMDQDEAMMVKIGRLTDRPVARPTVRPTDYIYKLPINRSCGKILY